MNNLVRTVAISLIGLWVGFISPAQAQNNSVYVPASQTEPCWSQFSNSFYVWTCASSSLPPEGQPYALAIGVIVGDVTVVTVDSGATSMVGQQLAADVLRRFPNRKLFVLNTQPKPEHFLGNSGVKNYMLGTENLKSFNGRIVAGKKTADLIKQRCPACVEQLAQRMGSQAVLDSEPVDPDFILSRRQGSFRILNPELLDWQFQLLDDLDAEEVMVVNNPNEGIYWVGNLVQKTMVPDLYDGKMTSRLDYLYQLMTQHRAGDVIVSSVGPVSVDWLRRNIRYFKDMQIDLMVGIEAGATEAEVVQKGIEQLQEAVPNAGPADIQTHRLNIQRGYRELKQFLM